jgi:RNA polymerase sigma-70 factor (ECF subfamily)
MSSQEIDDRARRFRDAALPHLDEVYTLARYLLRDMNDAEDAVQECYLRALCHFDSFRGPAMKPWLLAILKNVCNSEFMRRRRGEVPTDFAQDGSAAATMPLWQETQTSPEKVMQQQDSARMWRLVAELPEPFREAIVLREVNDLSYKEIARLAGVQVGTVMSRLARAPIYGPALLRATDNRRHALCFGCGYLTAFMVTRNHWRDEMIKRGVARYNWTTGKWEWGEPPKESRY